MISVRCSPSSGPVFHMQRCPPPKPSSAYNGIVTDHKWQVLGGAFERVVIERLDGRNIANKFEAFLAHCVIASLVGHS